MKPGAPGRKRGAYDEHRKTVVRLGLSRADLTAAKRAAEARCESLSAWMRGAIQQRLERTAGLPALIRSAMRSEPR